MHTWDAITSRRQVRSFTDEPISDLHVTQILEAGRRAPSGRNRQPWDFVVVRDREQLSQLSGVWQGASWIDGSQITIALVVPISEEDGGRIADRFDLGQAVMQMMIAATDLGIASGQAGCRDQALASNVLGFPDDRECALLIALGYPADRPLRPIRRPDRRPFDDVAHFDRW